MRRGREEDGAAPDGTRELSLAAHLDAVDDGGVSFPRRECFQRVEVVHVLFSLRAHGTLDVRRLHRRVVLVAVGEHRAVVARGHSRASVGELSKRQTLAVDVEAIALGSAPVDSVGKFGTEPILEQGRGFGILGDENAGGLRRLRGSSRESNLLVERLGGAVRHVVEEKTGERVALHRHDEVVDEKLSEVVLTPPREIVGGVLVRQSLDDALEGLAILLGLVLLLDDALVEMRDESAPTTHVRHAFASALLALVRLRRGAFHETRHSVDVGGGGGAVEEVVRARVPEVMRAGFEHLALVDTAVAIQTLRAERGRGPGAGVQAEVEVVVQATPGCAEAVLLRDDVLGRCGRDGEPGALVLTAARQPEIAMQKPTPKALGPADVPKRPRRRHRQRHIATVEVGQHLGETLQGELVEPHRARSAIRSESARGVVVRRDEVAGRCVARTRAADFRETEESALAGG